MRSIASKRFHVSAFREHSQMHKVVVFHSHPDAAEAEGSDGKTIRSIKVEMRFLRERKNKAIIYCSLAIKKGLLRAHGGCLGSYKR